MGLQSTCLVQRRPTMYVPKLHPPARCVYEHRGRMYTRSLLINKQPPNSMGRPLEAMFSKHLCLLRVSCPPASNTKYYSRRRAQNPPSKRTWTWTLLSSHWVTVIRREWDFRSLKRPASSKRDRTTHVDSILDDGDVNITYSAGWLTSSNQQSNQYYMSSMQCVALLRSISVLLIFVVGLARLEPPRASRFTVRDVLTIYCTS
jgi:hypothetical protein